MYKAYDWRTSQVIEVSDDLGIFIIAWDVDRSTEPARWGNFFGQEREQIDFCFTGFAYEYWTDCYETVCNNADRIHNIPHKKLVMMNIDELVNLLKGGM